MIKVLLVILIFVSALRCEPPLEKIKIYSLCTKEQLNRYDGNFTRILGAQYELCLESYSGDQDIEGAIKVASFVDQKIDLVLRAIEENWGAYFIYADLDSYFFIPFGEYLENRMNLFNLLIAKRTVAGNLSTGFFVSRADSSTRLLWQAIKSAINCGTFKNDEEAIDVLLNYLHRRRNQFGIKWNHLSAGFYSTDVMISALSGAQARGGLPYECAVYFPSQYHARDRFNKEFDACTTRMTKQKKLAYQSCYKEKHSQEQKFVLLTMLYNETDNERIQEYLTCLDNNSVHPLISDIHVLYDCSKDIQFSKNVIKRYLKKKSLKMTKVKGRQSFNDFFRLARERYQGRKIIIANADIYFNETLSFLLPYDLTNTFIALSRWDWFSNDCRIFTDNYAPRSQDAWIYKDPLPLFPDDNILMGTMTCDGRISFVAKNLGLNVINPSLTVQAIHLHRSNVRHYNPKKYYKGQKHSVEPTVLFLDEELPDVF